MFKVIVIGGPTASGKSNLAMHLALHHKQAVIINADSMQLYDGLKILSAQPSKEDLKLVPHKLYSLLNAKSPAASLANWLHHVREILEECEKTNTLPIIVGGTGMYLQSLIFGLSDIPAISIITKDKVAQIQQEKGLAFLYEALQNVDPTYAAKISANDPQRILRAYEVFLETGQTFSSFHENNTRLSDGYFFQPIIMNPPRATLYENCNQRLEHMLTDDCKAQILKCDHTYPLDHIIRKTLGFQELLLYYHGIKSQDETLPVAQQMTRNYAKRQYTWFKNRMLTIPKSDYCAKPFEVTEPLNEDVLTKIKTHVLK